MSFFVGLVAGGFLLAVWADTRFEGRRPATPTWRIVHVAASCILLQLAGFLGGRLIGEHSGAIRPTTAALVVILPVLVYAFVSGLWLIRTLAELGFARR
jgi:mannitol-specific phosphotransferase system IIBC component